MRRPGRIVYVVERFPERSQTFVQNEIRELRQFGIEPEVFALYPPLDADPSAGDLPYEWLGSAGERPGRVVAALARAVFRHPRGAVRAAVQALGRPGRLQLHALAKALLLVARLEGEGPTRIHAHFARASASTAMLAAAILGCPFSFTAHARDIFERPFDVARKLDRADVSITVCEYNQRFIERTWPGRGRLEVVPCGVDPARFRRSRPYRRDPFTVVAVGRLLPKKGFDVLVEACAVLASQGRQVRCRILGDGPERPDLTRLVRARELVGHVTLEGSVGPDTVRSALEEATAFCLPCRIAPDGDRDSQPVVIKEAMAMGVPVVASHEVGCPEMVVDGVTGLLVPPEDPVALATALDRLAGMAEDELVAMGERARRRVEERFTLAQQAAGVVRAWDAASSVRF